MTQHGSQLRFRAHLGQQTPIDRDLATGQRPGIGHRAVQDREFIRQRNIADRRKPLADRLHVRRQRRVDVIGTAL